MGDLTVNFSMIELACKCGCDLGMLPEHYTSAAWTRMLADLEAIRAEVEEAVFINSGIRCERYNRDVGGVKNSAHLRAAADIRLGYTYGPYRFRLLAAAVKCGVTGIGVAETFIHIDRDTVKPRPAAWTY